jgi:nuclear transport factor 2 (NTF2) superfamily protein
VDVDAAARAWVEAWSRGWAAKDPAFVAEAYAPDCVFRSHPFREPADIFEYARENFEVEEEVEFEFGEPVAAGNRAAVEYWATMREEGREVTLAGTAVLRFGGDGLVVEHRDYWTMEPGRRKPPAGWFRASPQA